MILETIEDKRVEDYRFVMLEGRESWTNVEVKKPTDCPVCRGRKLRKAQYCTFCDRCGLDDFVEYPGLPVGKYLK